VLYELHASRGARVVTYAAPLASAGAANSEQDPTRTAGIRAGMPLAEASALAAYRQHAQQGPQQAHDGRQHAQQGRRPVQDGRQHAPHGGEALPVHLELHDPLADRLALEELAEECRRFSPTVGLEEGERPESLLLDVSGLAPLFGGEPALVELIVRALSQRGLTARVAIADTLGAAWAVSHFAAERAIVPAGESQRVIGPLDVEALRLPPATCEQLAELGLRRIEQVAVLPRSTLLARFGPLVLLRMDQARGLAAEAIVARAAPEELEFSWPFEHPTGRREMIEFALDELVARACGSLARERRGVLRLACRFEQERGGGDRLVVGLYRPSASPRHVGELVRLKFEALRFSEPLSAIRLAHPLRAPRLLPGRNRHRPSPLALPPAQHRPMVFTRRVCLMPEIPVSSKRPRLTELPRPPLRTAVSYAEMHCKTNFSFLEGVSHADELALRAAELGSAALAVTDRNTLAGVVRAHAAAKELRLRLIIGAEIDLLDAPSAVLWTTDRASYGRLARMITLGRRQAPKGEFHLTFDELATYSKGLLCGVLPGRPREAEPDRALLPALSHYRELFGERAYLIGELYKGPDDQAELARLVALSRRARLPLVAAGDDVHYHARARLALQDALTAIRLGMPVAEAGEHLFANAERYLKSPDEMAERFAAAPGETPLEYLTRLTWRGAAERYPGGVPEKVRSLVEHELALIADLRYEAYFLTVYDLVRFAREREILCQGRGSAANSAVCFCLGVTAVDPERLDVLFERFLSRERNEAPDIDIDIDFEHERREEVLQYLYAKYGRERAGMTAEVITYRPRSAVRDVGKALGLSLDRVDALAKGLEGHHHHDTRLADRCRDAGIDPESFVGGRLLGLVGELVRHLGQHVGGIVMTQGPLCELVPIENAAMDDRTVIQWDKNDLDELGILKVDCLSLGMLTAIRKCFDLVALHTGRRVTLASIGEGDPQVYDMICQADTMGVFQIERRAQMSMLPRLKPRNFYDLVIEVALVRPGPIQGNMVHPYLRRRAGEEPIEYPDDTIRQVLERTLGVPLFQEQAMRLAVVAAGFTPGEANQLRRAMGAWRRPGIIDQFRKKLLEGMTARGLSVEFAEAVFRQISGFGEYGFPESHAASFALLVYASAWLKHYYPAAFAAALINSQPMGFYAPAQLVRSAREHGVTVLGVDVNASRWDCTLEDGALRLGLRLIKGLSESHAVAIEAARLGGPFRGWEDFNQRSRLGRAVVSRLADAGAFASLALDRRGALWQALGEEQQPGRLPLFDALEEADELVAPLPRLEMSEEVVADYRTAGLSLRAHPLEFQRARLEALGIVPASGLPTYPADRHVRVAGIVLVRQRPSTAKGITFVTLEDETGTVNLIIRQDVWQRFYRVARTAAGYLASGRLQRQEGVIHVLVSKLEDLGESLHGLKSQSRDFH
jgi:error-prone DNA polymerase